MAFDGKYNLTAIPVGTSGWNAIMTTNLEYLEDYISDIIMLDADNALDAYDAVYVASNGDVDITTATSGIASPVIGVSLEDADADENIRIMTRGIATNGGWSFTTGQKVYWSTTVSGGLTTTAPTNDYERQVIGVALSSTSMFVCPQFPV